MQAAGVFDQVSTEDGKADATTNYPTGYGTFSKGASHTENFDGDAYSGIGPFSLKKDSVMTAGVCHRCGLPSGRHSEGSARCALGLQAGLCDSAASCIAGHEGLQHPEQVLE